MELKVGDKVKILDGRVIYDHLGVHWVNARMNPIIGLETCVTSVGTRSVTLNIDPSKCNYAEYWLEKVED